MQVALYFGSLGDGHFLNGIPPELSRWNRSLWPDRDIAGFPWRPGLLDGGLLKNVGASDAPDGRVFWTCGGVPDLWHAFYWWDRSGDSRPASNSGFYVLGFAADGVSSSFGFALASWPQVVGRQRHPLVLQSQPVPR